MEYFVSKVSSKILYTQNGTIDSGNGLAPIGTESLRVAMLTNIHDAIPLYYVAS